MTKAHQAAYLSGAAILAGGLGLAIRDYRAWRALGAGGLPGTPGGWLRMTRLRLMMRDPLELATISELCGSAGDIGLLTDLPGRKGVRPHVSPHPIPHRQLTQCAPETAKVILRETFDEMVAAHPGQLVYARSHFEKHNDAVTLSPGDDWPAHSCGSNGEIGHIHPSDGSMHMILSPTDCRTVLAQGWGERHGLAGVAYGLPPTYTLVYAPRDGADIVIIQTILNAAIAYMRGDGPPGLPETEDRQGADTSGQALP